MTNAQKKKAAYYQEFDNQHEAIRGKVRSMNAIVSLEDAKQDAKLAARLQARKAKQDKTKENAIAPTRVSADEKLDQIRD